MKRFFSLALLLVLSCGGAFAFQPDRISLDSSRGNGGKFCWRMCKASDAGLAEQISMPGFDDGAWMEARVPGTVLTNLVENGVLPDPYFSDNNRRDKGLIPEISEVGRDYYTYWFRTEFEVPSFYRGQNVWIHAEGINYRAEFWINGHLCSTLTGMFRSDDIEITEYARAGEKNALAVLVYPVDSPGNPKVTNYGAAGESSNGGDGYIGRNSTMLMSVGWDFTAFDGIRDRNTGIWQGISLYSTGTLAIRNPFVRAELSHPLYDAADLTVSVELTSTGLGIDPRKGVKVRGEIKGTGIVFEKEVELYREETQLLTFSPAEFPQLHIDNPALWWPLGKGEQNLYELSMEVLDGGVCSDKVDTRFGIREIVATRDTPDGSKMFVVNGRPVFVRGSNWIPEAMLKDNEKRMSALLRMTARCGFNLLRLWGGGIVERECFYRLCDEYGLMVWEEFFMTGNTRHPQDKAVYFANVESSVKRIRNHPCVMFYVASNESSEVSGTRELLESLDGTRPYQQQSECDGIHDGSPYVQVNPMLHYLDQASPRGSRINGFNPEYGFTGMPHYTSLQRFLRPEEIWPMDKSVWDYLDGSGFGKLTTVVKDLTDNYGESSSIKEYGWKSQLLSAMNSKAIWECWNYNKLGYGDRFCSGVLFWSHSSPIPMIKNHMWDWYLIPTASLYHTMHALEPVHIQYDYLKNTVSVCNDKPEAMDGLTAYASVYNLDSRRVWTGQASSISLPSDGVANDVLRVEFPAGTSAVHFIDLVLKDASGKVLSRNFYWESSDKYEPGTLSGPCASGFEALQDMPAARLSYNLRKRSDAECLYFDVTLRNVSRRIAFFNELLLLGDDGLPLPFTFTSDNYFTLLPGESRTVSLEIARSDAPASMSIHAEGWNTAEKVIRL